MLSLCLSGLVSAVLVICLTAQVSHARSEWNQESRDYVVQVHNDRRRDEGGCHINKLVYDLELEKQAKVWAERCVFKHELKEGRGENLAWDSNILPEKELIMVATDSWFEEKKQYSYGQHSCSNSGSCHYTQMVWGTTNKIGCYSTRCGYLTGAAQNAWYIVCFYTPKGNWNGEKPYEKGCDSPCQSGQTEEDGLCLGEGGKNQGHGKTGACEDELGNCKLWAKDSQCEVNPSYMLKHCKKSCKACESNESCKDLHATCGEWSKRGECKNNPSYMSHNCAKSCKKC